MKTLIYRRLVLASVLISVAVSGGFVYSHCQIPCGIYGDKARFEMIGEHLDTIEKSMKMITELSGKEKINYNQLVRWIENKEKHADEISDIVTYYFMAQRVKPVEQSEDAAYQKYVTKLSLLHKMLFYAMKCKQTTEVGNIEKLRGFVSEFRGVYFGEHSHK
jgi:nickel superoxide dismutase